MTELIGTHQVPCISDTDYAAYALYMKCVAEQVEAALLVNQDAASAALNRPMAVWTTSDNIAQGSGSSGGSGTFSYGYNWTPTYSFNTMATLNRQGWWLVGALVHCVSSAPVVGNNRILSLNVYPAGTPSSFYNLEDGESLAAASLQDTTWETNTTISGEDLHVAVNVYCTADPNTGPNDKGMQFFQGYSVENTGAETVTFTGTYWAIFLGDTPLIQA